MTFFRCHIMLILLCIYTVKGQKVSAQNAEGARKMGMAGAAFMISDHFSVFNHAAAMALAEELSIGISSQQSFGVRELNTYTAAAVYPGDAFAFGAGISNNSNPDFRQFKGTLGAAHAIGFGAIGLRFNYHQLNASGFGSFLQYSFDIDGLFQLHEQWWFSSQINNISQRGFEAYPLPVTLSAGISYQPHAQLLLNIAASGNNAFGSLYYAGFEYFIVESVAIRSGISAAPWQPFMGLGFYTGKFQIDAAAGRQWQLGTIYQISLAHALR